MKHPVLHVKKGVRVYDDSLEEREAPRRADPLSQFLTGARRRRRRGRLTFFPLLILALALVFVPRLIPRKPQNVAVLAGWEAVLRAEPHEGALLVGVTFIRAAGSPAPEPPPVAIVRLFSPETREKQSVMEPLVRSPFTVRARMVDRPLVRTVQAEVIIGDQKKFLATVPRRYR